MGAAPGAPAPGAVPRRRALADAFPLSGLACDGCKAGKGRGLFVIEAAEFRHGGDERVGGQRSDARDAAEDLVPAGEHGIGGDQAGDLGVERLDMPVDLFEPLAALALEEGDAEVLLAVQTRGPITHQAVAGIDAFSHLGLLRASGGPDRRPEGGGHAGQQHGVDAIGFGQRAGGLGKAPGTFRVAFDAGPVGKCSFQRPVTGAGCLIGDPSDRPDRGGHPGPGNQS
jgi:hypothetical protein